MNKIKMLWADWCPLWLFGGLVVVAVMAVFYAVLGDAQRRERYEQEHTTASQHCSEACNEYSGKESFICFNECMTASGFAACPATERKTTVVPMPIYMPR